MYHVACMVAWSCTIMCDVVSSYVPTSGQIFSYMSIMIMLNARSFAMMHMRGPDLLIRGLEGQAADVHWAAGLRLVAQASGGGGRQTESGQLAPAQAGCDLRKMGGEGHKHKEGGREAL